MSVLSCHWCGMDYDSKRADSQFCNPACKQKYWRWKHKLDLLRHQILVSIEEVSEYLKVEKTEHEASLVLLEVADLLCIKGFLASEEALAEPMERPDRKNQLGGQDAN